MLSSFVRLPWLGFVPDEVSAAPPVAVARLAERLGVDPGVLEEYGRREQTRTDHLRSVAKYLGWKQASPGSAVFKELEQFLLDRAMEHDSPTLLFNLAREYPIAAKVIRPGVVTLMVGTARKAATDLTHETVADLLTEQVCSDLEWLRGMDAHLLDLSALPTDGSVGSADGAAPVPGDGGPPFHQSGAGAPRSRASVSDPVGDGGAVGGGPAG
ncbi:DUF4158 domain-containing protein [Nonomuraea muscovyensis]|uniref:DUF4158 domain-containing protein n=1 Tax=Nonomuraea muscovyensis TaxID=1124761 RepID=UPI00340D76D7